ncbi:RNA polymerase sigma factor [Streptomyces sp. NPDC004436]
MTMPPPPGAPDHWTPEQEAAFRRFHQNFAPRFLRYAETKLPNQHDAEDAVHSTFEVVVRDWPRVTGMEHPTSYAWKILKNRIADLHRAHSRIGPVDDERLTAELDRNPGGDPGCEIVNLLALQEAVQDLPDRQQEALFLEALGWSLLEAAELMGIKEESAGMNLKRARARLKRRLEAQNGRRGTR